MFCILGSVIGGVGGLNQINLRVLCTYYISFFYFFIRKYFLLVTEIIYFFLKKKNKNNSKIGLKVFIYDFIVIINYYFFNIFYSFYNNKLRSFFSTSFFFCGNFFVGSRKVIMPFLIIFFCKLFSNKEELKVVDILSKISSINNMLVSFYYINNYNIIVDIGILKFLSEDLYNGRFFFSPVQYIVGFKKSDFFFYPIFSFADKLIDQAIRQELKLVFEFFKGCRVCYNINSNYYLKDNNFVYIWEGIINDFKIYK